MYEDEKLPAINLSKRNLPNLSSWPEQAPWRGGGEQGDEEWTMRQRWGEREGRKEEAWEAASETIAWRTGEGCRGVVGKGKDSTIVEGGGEKRRGKGRGVQRPCNATMGLNFLVIIERAGR